MMFSEPAAFIWQRRAGGARAGEQDPGRTAHLGEATVTSCGHILLKCLKVCLLFSSETKVCEWETSKENSESEGETGGWRAGDGDAYASSPGMV